MLSHSPVFKVMFSFYILASRRIVVHKLLRSWQTYQSKSRLLYIYFMVETALIAPRFTLPKVPDWNKDYLMMIHGLRFSYLQFTLCITISTKKCRFIWFIVTIRNEVAFSSIWYALDRLVTDAPKLACRTVCNRFHVMLVYDVSKN